MVLNPLTLPYLIIIISSPTAPFLNYLSEVCNAIIKQTNKQTNKPYSNIQVFFYLFEADDINLQFQQMFTAIVAFSFSIVFLKIKVKKEIKNSIPNHESSDFYS